MSQYNNIVITPNIGVSSNPNIEFSGIGNTTIKLEYYDTNNSSLAVQSEDKLLFSFINTDEENPDLIYAINDDDGTTALSVSNSGLTSISNLQASLIQTPLVNHLATGAASTTKITTKHYETDGGYLAFESGISTSQILSVSNSGLTSISNLQASLIQTPLVTYLATGAASTTKITTKHYGTDGGYLAFESGISTSHIFSIGVTEENNEVYVINDNVANPVLTVYDSGETGLIRASFASTNIGAASTQKMEISAVSRDNGLLEITNYGGNQLFSVSNNQDEDAFAVYRYANYDNLSIRSFDNRKLFNVSPLGIVTTYGALRVGTSNTTANSSVFNELYGNVNVKAPFSTTTEYVSIVPKFRDNGALSFEAPVGAAQTDRGTQIFSISNNFTNSIFRVNDLNRQPILEASANGNVGLGTADPQVKLEVQGITRVTSAGSTAGEQIDIRYYRNIAPQNQNYTGIELTNNRGAISFDSPTGLSTDGISLYPASLFAITNDPTGNIFSVAGYGGYWSGGGVPAIDVTQFGRIGIGTTNPIADFEIKRYSTVTGDFQIQNRMVFSEVINPSSSSSTNILLRPYTPGITTVAPTRGSSSFEGVLDASLNGGQLVTVVNDNSNIFTINRFAGLSTTNVTGTRTIETVLNVTSSGNIGIGTTTPQVKLDVIGDARISGITTLGLTSTTSPTINSTMSFELTNNTTLTVRVRGTDGTVRTGIVTLS